MTLKCNMVKDLLSIHDQKKNCFVKDHVIASNYHHAGNKLHT